MPKQRLYTDEQFIEVVANSYSVAQCLNKLNLRPTGGNYKVFHRRVSMLNIDTSHFTGQGHLKNKKHNWSPKIPISDLLKENTYYQSHKLKLRLIKEGYKEHKCENCNKTEWLGNPIPLELEHKNGINTDNRIENLSLLCPNCHALTNTYRGKNKKYKV